jgi:hypothetical protein
MKALDAAHSSSSRHHTINHYGQPYNKCTSPDVSWLEIVARISSNLGGNPASLMRLGDVFAPGIGYSYGCEGCTVAVKRWRARMEELVEDIVKFSAFLQGNIGHL